MIILDKLKKYSIQITTLVVAFLFVVGYVNFQGYCHYFGINIPISEISIYRLLIPEYNSVLFFYHFLLVFVFVEWRRSADSEIIEKALEVVDESEDVQEMNLDEEIEATIKKYEPSTFENIVMSFLVMIFIGNITYEMFWGELFESVSIILGITSGTILSYIHKITFPDFRIAIVMIIILVFFIHGFYAGKEYADNKIKQEIIVTLISEKEVKGDLVYETKKGVYLKTEGIYFYPHNRILKIKYLSKEKPLQYLE